MDTNLKVYSKIMKKMGKECFIVMKIKKFLFREFLVIQLKNNRTRRVDDIYNIDRLQEYLDTMVKLS